MQIFVPALALALGTVVMVWLAVRFRDEEAYLVLGSWGAHVFAVAAQFWILREVYHGGDSLTYHGYASNLAAMVDDDPGTYVPEVLKLVLQIPARLPWPVLGEGQATGSMTVIVTLLELLTGRNPYAVAILIALGSTIGELYLYRTFRETLPREYHRRLLIATCLIPSVVFWSSAILKEAVVLVFLGPLVYSTHRVLNGRMRALPIGLVSFAMIGLVKPYILFAFVAGAAVWLYAHRSIARDGRVVIRPAWAVVALVLAVAGVIWLGQLFPRFAADQLLDEVVDEQGIGTRMRGGSAFDLLGGMDRSAESQVLLAPFALFNAWFRPSLLDAHNAQAALSALETTVLMVLGGHALFTTSPMELVRRIFGRPVLLFGLMFALALGVGVGLTSSNFGSISRYRMPLVPFLAAIVVIWQVPTVKRSLSRPKPVPARPERQRLPRSASSP
jgi:hypothetical protein